MSAPSLTNVKRGDSVTLVNAVTTKGPRYVMGVYTVTRTTAATVWIGPDTWTDAYRRDNGKRFGDARAPVYLRPTIPGDAERAKANALRTQAEDARTEARRNADAAVAAKARVAYHERVADDERRSQQMYSERATESANAADRLAAEAAEIERGIGAAEVTT